METEVTIELLAQYRALYKSKKLGAVWIEGFSIYLAPPLAINPWHQRELISVRDFISLVEGFYPTSRKPVSQSEIVNSREWERDRRKVG